MKKVLLLGDSIRMNYAPYVFKELNGIATVCSPEENCRFAKYTLSNFDAWIEQFGTPDIIHWNNGIWDASYTTDQKPLSTKEQYLFDMLRICQACKKTGAKIIFATSTPPKPGAQAQNATIIKEYSDAAVELLKDKVDEINDLWTLISSNIDDYICEDKVHLSKEGIKVAGKQVINVIKKYLY